MGSQREREPGTRREATGRADEQPAALGARGSRGVWGNRVPGFTPLHGVRVGRAVPATRENLR